MRMLFAATLRSARSSLMVVLVTMPVACRHARPAAAPTPAAARGEDVAEAEDFTLTAPDETYGGMRYYAEAFSRELYTSIAVDDEDKAARVAMVNARNLESLFPESDESPVALPRPAPARPARETAPTAPREAPSAATVNVRVLMYVKSPAAAVRAAASPLGTVMRSLPRGTPVLAEVEGDWAKLENDRYVAVAELSPAPVAPAPGQAPWRQGAANAKARRGVEP